MAPKAAKVVPPASAITRPTPLSIARSLFHLLLAARTCAVLFSNIWDCDEVYNYFEPAHFLIYGFGCQTWEYDPNYGLRSYAYLLVHIAMVYVPATVFMASKIFVFYFIRFFLVLLEVWSQSKLVHAITEHFGGPIGDMTLLLAAFSPGYFQASTAFLPSSTAMVLLQFALSSFIDRHYYRTALAGAVSAFLVWPFSAVLYIPAAIAIFWDLKMKFIPYAIKLSGIVLGLVACPIIIIDSLFYGKLVIASFNIAVYNFIAVDESRGSHLYGTAPLSYYIMNLFLNFNAALGFICFGLFALIFVSKRFLYSQAQGDERRAIGLVLASTLMLWLGIFFPQAHKEERFLYPIYPLICITASAGVQYVTSVIYRVFHSFIKLRAFLADCIQLGFIAIFVLMSLSRCAALYFNYHGSMDVYLRFSESVKLPTTNSYSVFNFCVGREWHRSPGHFLLNDNRLRLRFVESAFEGLLPGHYFENMTIGNATQAPRFDMNDLNREEKSHYVPVTSCHFLADINMESAGPKSEREPNYAADKSGKWTILIRLPYLATVDREDVSMSAWKSLVHRLLRAFYVPYFSLMYTAPAFRDYVVLQNTALLPLKVASSL